MAWEYSAVLAETIQIIQAHVEDVEVSEASRFAQDLALDSQEVMDVVEALEERFEVNIPISALPEMQTVGQTAKFLLELVQRA
jgi:acyl carrier protein